MIAGKTPDIINFVFEQLLTSVVVNRCQDLDIHDTVGTDNSAMFLWPGELNYPFPVPSIRYIRLDDSPDDLKAINLISRQ
jgi:hypothetical protein